MIAALLFFFIALRFLFFLLFVHSFFLKKAGGELNISLADYYEQSMNKVYEMRQFSLCTAPFIGYNIFMDSKAFSTLEFNKITGQLAQYAGSPMGRALCEELQPGSDIEEIRHLQAETAAGLSRVMAKGNPSFGHALDIRPTLARLSVGSSLSAVELLQIAGLLENTARVKAYGKKEREDIPDDILSPVFSRLEPIDDLASEIRRCILSEDEISDDASSALRQIRRKIAQSGDRIKSQLNQFLNGPSRAYLQDAVITQRSGRYCVPVKQEYRNQVQGMIHDQSSTGATLFVEPMAIVKLNNDIRELEIEEKKEIERILAELSAKAAEHGETLRWNLENLVALDFIFARARLAVDMNATEPILNAEGRILLRKARHPLIDRDRVVPIDVELGDAFRLLVVTGPNTGGKTVSLKTVGLLTLMGQAGLHIPALDRSELAVFENVYADIGDEQSIEQSLSTFSSHMKNIVSFLEKTDEKSLVLFDELGAGTDPTEGAALAVSILSTLLDRQARVMATTHYSELKLFALATEGVENASCEFNVETLRPTYRLLVGIPGKSNAFAISGKLGLPDYIIDDAKRRISEEDASFEDVIASLEESRLTMEEDRSVLDAGKEKLAREEQSLRDRSRNLERRSEEIIRKANEEALAVLQEAKDFADRTMRELRKQGVDDDILRAMDRRRGEIRARIDETGKKLAVAPEKRSGKELSAKDIHLGDAVRVISMDLKGTVASMPDAKDMVQVQLGILRSKVHISDLELLDEPTVTAGGFQKTGSGKIKIAKSLSVSTEINLLGKTVDEAIAELDKYLDDAYLAHLPSVRVVHGKGTGALRKGVHNFLRRQKHVADFHLAEFGEGDAGVTIVTFRG